MTSQDQAEAEAQQASTTGCADFLARVAHDLRSPLGVVAEVVPMIREDMKEHLTDEHRVLLGLAERGVLRLKAHLERLRLLADLELSRLESHPNRVDLVPLVEHGVATTIAVEPRDRVQVTLHNAENPVFADVDATKVAQAIIELVSNAMRHAHRRVRVSIETEGEQARVVVEDDGDGVPELRRNDLFRRFGPRASRSGVGVGLSIARDLIRAQGGSLACEEGSLPSARPGAQGMKFVASFALSENSRPEV